MMSIFRNKYLKISLLILLGVFLSSVASWAEPRRLGEGVSAVEINLPKADSSSTNFNNAIRSLRTRREAIASNIAATPNNSISNDEITSNQPNVSNVASEHNSFRIPKDFNKHNALTDNRLNARNKARLLRLESQGKAKTFQNGHLQGRNKAGMPDRRRLNIMNSLNKQPTLPTTSFPDAPGSGSNVPLPASQHQQPASLPTPVASFPAPSATTNTGGGNSGSGNGLGHHSSSKSTNSSSHQGTPLAAPLLLGLCGHLPIPIRKRTLRKIISEISRRFKNGIGFIFSPRAPNICAVGGCYLAFAHQVTEVILRLSLGNHNISNGLGNNQLEPSRGDTVFLQQIAGSTKLFYINLNNLPKYGVDFNYRIGPQINCGPFYLVR